MEIGSIVEYVGGQCAPGKAIFPLSKNTPYQVTWVGIANFLGGNKLAIGIDAAKGKIFRANMFREIQPPKTSEEISEVLKESVVLQD